MDLKLGDTRRLIDACKAKGLLRNQCAYVLATAYHETAHRMKPIKEMGGEKYLKSKPYYPYVGRGYVQITWEANYRRASQELGLPNVGRNPAKPYFLANPNDLMKAEYAAPIIVIGMKEGWFTGKALADYVTRSKSDFVGARKIVNGSDRAKLIAGYAVEYDRLLKAEGYIADAQEPASAPQPVPAPQPAPQPQPAPAAKSGGFWARLFAIIGMILKGRRS